MRISFSVPNLTDHWILNLGIWDCLRAVRQLTDIPAPEACENVMTITFQKKDAKRDRESGHTFYPGVIGLYSLDEHDEQVPLVSEPPITTKISFCVPKDFNAEECFSWGYSEVLKLAYAMTGGRILPVGDIAYGVCSEDQNSYVFSFRFDGEVDYAE